MRYKSFYHAQTHTLTYLVYDAESKDAVLIDPVLDFDNTRWLLSTKSARTVLRFIRENELQLRWILDTHAHADHMTAMAFIKDETGAQTAIGSAITKVQKLFEDTFDLGLSFRADGHQWDQLLEDGQTVSTGRIQFQVMATPGHTPACSSYKFGDWLFTGDALFMPDFGTGRCDFPGGSARDLYRSIMRIYDLPEETVVLVGHDYQPKGRELLFTTTVGSSKRENCHLKLGCSEAEFVAFRQGRDKTLNPPALLAQSLPINLCAGRLPQPDARGRVLLHIPIQLES